LEEILMTILSLIGASGATQHFTQKMHHQILLISKVSGASNDRPVDGTLGAHQLGFAHCSERRTLPFQV
jgi:hypothetical protein